MRYFTFRIHDLNFFCWWCVWIFFITSNRHVPQRPILPVPPPEAHPTLPPCSSPTLSCLGSARPAPPPGRPLGSVVLLGFGGAGRAALAGAGWGPRAELLEPEQQPRPGLAPNSPASCVP